jgi:hypothetical protein
MLEAESWQAELIISGIALFGSALLPAQIERLINFTLTTVQVEDYSLFYFLYIILYFSAYLVIAGFVLHFVLRAFWVGLVGFNSVFPGTINTENDSYYSKYFLKKVAEDLPLNSNVIIRNLDNFCSVIFAIVGVFIMVMLAFVIDVGVLYAFKLLLHSFLPTVSSKYLYLIVIVIFYAFIISILIFNLGRLKKSETAQLWYYRIFSTFNRVFLHLFYRPTQYISFSIITNIDYKKYSKYVIIMSIISGISTAPIVFDSNLMYFAENSFGNHLYMSSFDRPDKMIPTHYENMELSDDQPIFSAVLENDIIRGQQFKVFVPIFHNEKMLYESCIEEEEVPEDYDKEAKRRWQQMKVNKCYTAYHQFYINDRPIEPNSSIRMNHPNQGEAGMLFYLPSQQLSSGQQLLKIEKLNLATQNVFRQISIPFQYEQ